MDSNRWMINRAGLINFWYYDEEVFDFSDGRLLLRGSNGSGKSVTMQSFIPLLLDGNKSPERLDPFGSKARKLENYLLGEEDSEKEENTAYLFIEFKKKESENYITIGMGMKAVRGKNLQSWGFSITDGRRIGQDFFLYKNIGEKIPLTKKELENRIADGGQVCDSSGDYMKMVNTLLFGFDEIEEYDELVKLLVQLRTPKLSKDFKPTVVYEIMENSLQPLSEDDLRPMSEAIENMDNIKSRLEQLKESKKAVNRIKASYDRYNSYILMEKAKRLITATEELNAQQKEKLELQNKISSSQKAYREAEENLINLEIRRKAAEEKKKELDRHDSLGIKEKIVDVEKDIEELKKQKGEKEQQLNKKRASLLQLEIGIKDMRSREEQHVEKIEGILSDMESLSGDFAFDEHSFMEDELNKDLRAEYSFSYVKSKLSSHMANIDIALKALEKERAKNLEYDRALKNLENARNVMSSKSKVLEQANLLLHETKEELVEKVYMWNNANTELKLSAETLVQVSRAINGFSSSSSFDEIISLIRKDFSAFEGTLSKELYQLQSRVEALIGQQADIKEQLLQWEHKKDPEPFREEKVLLNRARLEAEGIPHVPLYKAVDFTGDYPEEIKGRIEEALIEMGIIDALIIPSSYKEKIFEMDGSMADKYIFSQPNFLAHNLSEYLKVDSLNVGGISFEDIDNALRGILSDKKGGSTFIGENGEYGIGILQGKVTNTYRPKYIGSQARKRFREEMVEALRLQLLQLEDEAAAFNADIEGLKNRLEVLYHEVKAFPDRQDLLTALKEVEKAQFEYDMSIREVSGREQEEKTVYIQLKDLRQQIYEYTARLALKAEVEVFEEAAKASRKYKDALYELEREHSRLLQNLENLKISLDAKEDLEADVDNISYDLTLNRRKNSELEAVHRDCLEQLQLSDYEQIKHEIDECIKALATIPEEVKTETRRSEREKAASAQYSSALSGIEERLSLTGQLVEIYLASFKEDYQLGFVIPFDAEASLAEEAKKVCRLAVSSDKLQRDDYIKALYEKFQENSQYLREYIISTGTIFDEEAICENHQLLAAYTSRRRLVITGKVRGKEVGFYDLVNFIEEGADEAEKLLRESDRQLFEDILVKNISKKIRAKIYHSEQWVKKMNQLMESMNTSSGLSFSLRWSSRKAETEEQLDTSELVELLKQEGTLMKESDLNKLSEHFRSKISEARRMQEETGKSQSFHSIMREILDYRKWFEFRLFFVKTGQNKKELTNNAFYQFSGGEKAMAMYVPLFSAVYARYLGARRDCPRLISLDEAFAGVDERNIRDMFRLLRELNLDFVINSQILWGDYDTVPSLAISELIRPDNATFVTVIRYLWNGKIKELIT